MVSQPVPLSRARSFSSLRCRTQSCTLSGHSAESEARSGQGGTPLTAGIDAGAATHPV